MDESRNDVSSRPHNDREKRSWSAPELRRLDAGATAGGTSQTDTIEFPPTYYPVS